jgi:acyl carrier protein
VTRDDAYTLVATVLHGIAPEIDLDALDPGEPFQEEADIDSMDFLNLVAGLCDETGIDIPERDYQRLATLADIVSYLEARAGDNGVKPGAQT